MQNKHIQHFIIISLMVLLAAASRFLMIPNFSAIAAMGLFGAACFRNKIWAFVVPFVALFLSDLIFNNYIYSNDGVFTFFYEGALFTYLGFGLIVLLGLGLLKKISVANVIGASISASLVFFLVSNLGSWMSIPAYTKDLSGLLSCYIAGIPFLQYSLFGDLVYSGIFFGTYAWFIKPYFQSDLVKQHA